MAPLHLTSCLFSTVVMHSFYRQVLGYHHIFLLLTVTSILFHTTHGDLIRKIDKFVAHLTYIMVVMDTKKVIAVNKPWLLFFPLLAACMWFGQSLFPKRAEEMHVCLHLTSVVGMHMYIWNLY